MSLNLPTHFRGGLFMVLAMGTFVASDSFLKLAIGRLPPMELMALRATFGSILGLGLIAALGEAQNLRVAFNRWVLARGACEVGASLFYVLAVFHMPIADVASIVLLAPLLIIIGAALVFKAKVDGLRLGLIIMGLLGALMVAQPGTSAASPYAALAFLAAVASAIRDLMARKIPPAISGIIVAFVVLMCLAAATILGTLLFEVPLQPNLREVAFTALGGLFGITGQFCMFLAFRQDAPQRVAPFMYTLMLWAIGLGYVFTGVVPNALALLGMMVIAVAGLILIRADAKKAPVPA